MSSRTTRKMHFHKGRSWLRSRPSRTCLHRSRSLLPTWELTFCGSRAQSRFRGWALQFTIQLPRHLGCIEADLLLFPRHLNRNPCPDDDDDVTVPQGKQAHGLSLRVVTWAYLCFLGGDLCGNQSNSIHDREDDHLRTAARGAIRPQLANFAH